MTSQKNQCFVVRHGATEWSLGGRHTGRTDIPLVSQGMKEAEALPVRLRDQHFCTVLSSPLARAMETCRLAGFASVAETDADLMEWDYGDYEGRTTVEIRRERPSWDLFADGAPGGETAEDVGARADRVIDRVRSGEGDGMCFAHGHLLRVLAARWIGLDPGDARGLALYPASVGILGWEDTTPVIVRWNVS